MQPFDEPTDVQVYPDGKAIRSMEWRKGDLLHRGGGKPAFIEFWKNGNIKSEQFSEDGECYRKYDLPTSVFYYETGEVKQEIWEDFLGLYDRGGDLPAVITYDLDGKVVRKEWYKKDVNLREGDAPEVEIYENGKLVRVIKNDKVIAVLDF